MQGIDYQGVGRTGGTRARNVRLPESVGMVPLSLLLMRTSCLSSIGSHMSPLPTLLLLVLSLLLVRDWENGLSYPPPSTNASHQ